MQVFGAENHRAQRPQVIAQQAHRLAVQAEFALQRGPVDFNLVRGAGQHPGPHEVALLAVPDHLRAADAAKGAEGGQEIDRFQDVCLALGVIPQEEVEAGLELRVQPGVIAEVAQPESCQMHGNSIQI